MMKEEKTQASHLAMAATPLLQALLVGHDGALRRIQYHGESGKQQGRSMWRGHATTAATFSGQHQVF